MYRLIIIGHTGHPFVHYHHQTFLREVPLYICIRLLVSENNYFAFWGEDSTLTSFLGFVKLIPRKHAVCNCSTWGIHVSGSNFVTFVGKLAGGNCRFS